MTGTPPPPPPVVPIADVDAARTATTEAQARLETTLLRASSLTEEVRQRRVNDEWSTVESLRHLVLVIDLWLSRTILGQPNPFHPIALPPTFMPPKLFPDSSIDPSARPSFDESCEVVRTRFEALGDYVERLTADELVRPIEAHARTVGGALSVIFNELAAHDRFINRDLDELVAASSQ